MPRKRSPVKVLHVTPEMAPLSKVGGLGDVAGSLPKALRRQGFDVRVLTPAWPGVIEKAAGKGLTPQVEIPLFPLSLRWRTFEARLWSTTLSGVPVYLLEQDELFSDPGIYPSLLDADRVLPFAALALAVLEFPQQTGWTPEIAHVHDWASALVPAFFRWHRHWSERPANISTILTIHNLAHQGIVDAGVIEEWHLKPEALGIDGLEFYGKANCLKGGIVASDVITTVSPSYSREIMTPEFGAGLDGLLTSVRGKVSGILNGIDPEEWNPVNDPYLPVPFDVHDTEGKRDSKRALLSRFDWMDDGRPVFSFVGRLFHQKGIDLLLGALPDLVKHRVRLIIIGTGEKEYENRLAEAAGRYKKTLGLRLAYDEELARLAYGGSDMFLMPSAFEPCGLSQLIALRYGTVPVVRATGGLFDTIVDVDENNEGYGFAFREFSVRALLEAINRAISAYRDTSRWQEITRRAMAQDFSWTRSAQSYGKLYKSLRHGKFSSPEKRRTEKGRWDHP
ncbi:MAG: glycogen synthase GlgA [Thermovirgaceae bacterium]